MSKYLFFLLIPFLLIYAKSSEPVEMTIHDFMHDYTKPVMKKYKKTGDASKIVKILEAVPAMAPVDEKEDWKKIVDTALQTKDYEKSCSGCHKPYKKKYKKKFRKRPVLIPAELIQFLEK